MRRAAKVDANQAEKFKKFGVWACRECGVEAPATAHQKRRAYCSKECMAKSYSKIMNSDRNPNFKAVPAKKCLICGCEFNSYKKDQKYCGQGCYQKQREKELLKTCLQCRVGFKAQHKQQKYCSPQCVKDSKPKTKVYVPKPREKNIKQCLQCNTSFQSPLSAERKFCSYACFLNSGGAQRAGDEAVKAMKKYGAKKDANHNEIFGALGKLVPVRDLSAAGFGVPDGIAWVKNSWQLFDVKNPNSGYGKRGLNTRQKSWADDWRGGKVYLIYTVDDAIKFAKGEFSELKSFPEDEKQVIKV